MIVDGRSVAEEVYTAVQREYEGLVRAVRLGIIMVGQDPVVASFVRIKGRSAERLAVEMVRVDIPEDSTTEYVIEALRQLSTRVDGIIVQLPLPVHMNVESILSAIPRELDIDGINPTIAESDRAVRAPVAGAVAEILHRTSVDISGKRAVVVGAGRLVGIPVAAMLLDLGADVSTVTLESGSLDELEDADLIVLGAGNPGFVTPNMITDGVILIDAGTSESSGKVVGDADPACASKCSVFTPVPGGIGPIAVAMIFKNLLELSKLHN